MRLRYRALAIGAFGLLALLPAALRTNSLALHFKMIFFWMIGLVAMEGLSRIPPLRIQRAGIFLYPAAILLLLLPHFFGIEVKGARSWIPIGPLRLQPSSLAVPILLVFGASLLARAAPLPVTKTRTLVLGAFFVPPILLILKEPDLGGATTIVALLAGLVMALPTRRLLLVPIALAAGTAGRLILGLGVREAALFGGPETLAGALLVSPEALGILGLVGFAGIHGFLLLLGQPRRSRVASLAVYTTFVFGILLSFGIEEHVKPHQRARILAYVAPELDPRGMSYNLLYSGIAIASGGFLGRSPWGARISTLGYLPEHHTDFIFASAVESFGLVGGVWLLVAYGLLLSAVLRVAERASSLSLGEEYPRYLACGAAGLLLYHLGMNVGMTLGLVPVIGIALPLVSYGGSGLLAICCMLGVLIGAEERS